jgi:uncharacterized protein
MRRAHLFCLLASSLFLLGAKAAEEPLGMVTGPKTGTYIAIGRDIAAAAADAGLPVLVKQSGGSIDNIKRINSSENAAVGIVQSDVLGFMGRSKNPETMRMSGHLRMILPLYREEVHILAKKEVKQFADLEGKTVVIGEDGSGHMLTSINLFAMTGVTPARLIRKAPPEGVLALLDAKVDAVVFVGGKPVKLFKNLEALKEKDNAQYKTLLNDIHFLPLEQPRMLEEYQVGEITRRDYDFVREPVPTIAVTAVLVTYDFSGASKRQKARCEQLRALSSSIRKNFKMLQQKGHPKWKEVKLDEPPPIWKKDGCTWRDVPKEVRSETKSLGTDLIDIIQKVD